MSKWKCLFIVALAVSLLIPLTAMNAAAEKVLKVGLMGPFTGPAANTGANIKGMLMMKLEEAGMKVGDYKIELCFIDSQSDPAKATNAYVEAVERKGMQVGIGGWHSSVAIAVSDIAVKYGVPHMGGMGAAWPLSEKIRENPSYHGYWFKFWGYPAMATVLYFDFLDWAVKSGAWKPANRNVGISAEETDWGRDWVVSAKGLLPKRGWEIVMEDYVAIGQTDFYPLLTRYKKENIPLIITTNTAAASVSAYVKQIREIGLKTLPIVDGFSWVGEWYELTGKSSNGVVDMNVMWTERSKPIQEKFIKKYNLPPTPSAAGISYDAAGMFLKVLHRALDKYGKLDSTTIHAIMKDEMRTGKLTYGYDDGAVIMKEYKFTEESYPDPVTDEEHWFMPVIQYRDGKIEVIYPLANKTMDFIPPK